MRRRREGGQGREPRAAPERESGGAAARPPPHPIAGRQTAGAPALTHRRQRGWSPLPPAGRRRPRGGAGARPAHPPQPPAPAGTAGNKRTRTNAPGRHRGRAQRRQASRNHALHDQNDASDTRVVARPGEAEGQNEAERPPAPLAPPAAQTGGAAHRPPPLPPQPPARERPGRADQPHGGRATPSQVGGKRDRAAPPKHPRRSKGPGQDTQRGTDRVERPYQRPAPGPREVRAPHHPGGGGGEADAAGAGAHTHTKGTRGRPEGQPDRAQRTHRPRGMAFQRARVRVTRTGRPATDSAGRAGRGGGTGGGHNTRYRPGRPKPAASAAHTRTGHCHRQCSSGALRHARTPRLGSHRASPRGSHWRQASSTGPAAPAPRANTH